MRRVFSVHSALATAAVVALFVHVPEDVRGQGTFSALPREVLAPADNPTDAPKIVLGKLLFWDPILSGDKDVACAICHHPRFGYAENLALSIGVNGIGLGETRRFSSPNTIPFAKRNSPTVLNVGFNGIDQAGRYNPSTAPMFWDLRAQRLEKQALEPLKSFEEMRGHACPEAQALSTVVSRLVAIPSYRALFSRAFGGREGIDAGCANCHSGPMFSDYKVHVLGVADNTKLAAFDTGVNQTYAFRTPSLRNLAHTAPDMHNGELSTLNEVLGFYNNVRSGGRDGGRRGTRNARVDRSQLDPLLRRLSIGGRRSEIIEFLNALNDDGFDTTIPDEVPSGLRPGGNIQ